MNDFNDYLDPDFIKKNLTLSGLYLVAYEQLQGAIIDNIREFFSFELQDGKPVPNEQYHEEVTSLHANLLHASCLWLTDHGVLTEGDMGDIERIRDHRNEVAHELLTLLGESDLDVNMERFLQIRALLKKIELWWVLNVHIPASPDLAGMEVSEENILPVRLAILDQVIAAAYPEYGERG